ELLVAIAILGVISTIATVSMAGLLANTSAPACSADAKTLRNAEETAYAAEGAYLSDSALVAGGYLHATLSDYTVVLSGSSSYTIKSTGSCANGGGGGVVTTAPAGTTTTTSSTTTTTSTTTSTTTTSTTTTTTPLSKPTVTITSVTQGSGHKVNVVG